MCNQIKFKIKIIIMTGAGEHDNGFGGPKKYFVELEGYLPRTVSTITLAFDPNFLSDSVRFVVEVAASSRSPSPLSWPLGLSSGRCVDGRGALMERPPPGFIRSSGSQTATSIIKISYNTVKTINRLFLLLSRMNVSFLVILQIYTDRNIIFMLSRRYRCFALTR